MQPFDLEAPRRSLLSALIEPHPCIVCGKDRTMLSPLGRGADRHEACARKARDWEQQIAKAADEDPVYVSTMDEIAGLQETAEHLWEQKARSLGLPDWVVERAIQNHKEGWEYD